MRKHFKEMQKHLPSLGFFLCLIGLVTLIGLASPQVSDKPKFELPTTFGSNAELQVMYYQTNFSRFVDAVNKDKIDQQLFKKVWKNFNLLKKFEERKINVKTLTEFANSYFETQENEFGIECERTCANNASIFYAGCRLGGGDAFTCFLTTEYYICVCEVATCGYNLTCCPDVTCN